MDNSRVFGGCDMLALLDSSNNSLWVPSSSPSFNETMVNFDQEIHQGIRRPSPKADRHRGHDDEDTGGEDLDLHHPEKKRRLTPEQVQFLEKNFEVENKLEPERKVQLAKELGLQPRQVAIWFQNRRARYKTKQLEKDYDSLKASYDRLKADYDSIFKEREDLQNEVKLLTKKLKQRDVGRANLEPDSPDHNQPHSETGGNGLVKMESEKIHKMETVVAPSIKQIEDASSAKSDVFDSESPLCAGEDPADSAHILDPDLQSDFSQGDEEHHLMMSKSFLVPSTPAVPTYHNLLKVEEECYDPNVAPCNFSLVDDQPFWSWLY